MISISSSQEARLVELIKKWESTGVDMDEANELINLSIAAYKEQRKQLAMMRGA